MKNLYSSSEITILDAAPAMIYISKNDTKTIQWCNKFMEKESGYTLGEMKEMGILFFQEVMHPDDYKLAMMARKKIKEQGNYFGGATRVKGRFNKDWHWVIGVSIPFTHNADGSVDQVVCVFINLDLLADTPTHLHKALKFVSRASYSSVLSKLTPREKEVLAELTKGERLHQTSKRLNISYNTLNVHLRKIKSKLEVENTISLVALAERMGLG